MPRYLVERTFPGGSRHPRHRRRRPGLPGRRRHQRRGRRDLDPLLRDPDRQKTFCVYDTPTPEAVRRVADRNKLPVDRITEVRVLDPYFYR